MTAIRARAGRDDAPSGPRRFLNPQDGCWHIQLTQGDTYVSGEPDEVLTTVLGSCISACIRDPQAGVGGMNHFLLPEGNGSDRNAERYGVNAMELLINGLLKQGASRRNLEAKIFGGANVMAGLSNVGTRNSAFAEQYLADEGIVLLGGSTGGELPRRIRFWPATGRASQLALREREQIARREVETARLVVRAEVGGNDVELF